MEASLLGNSSSPTTPERLPQASTSSCSPSSSQQPAPSSTTDMSSGKTTNVQWEDVYDDLILTALRQPYSKDRSLLLAADAELQALLSDLEATQIPFDRFGALNSFQRLLLHRLGDAYKVKRVMVPLPLSAHHQPHHSPDSVTGPNLPNAAPQQQQHQLVLSKMPDSLLPALSLAQIAAKLDAERPPLPAVFTSPTTNTTATTSGGPSSDTSSPLVSTSNTRSPTPSNEDGAGATSATAAAAPSIRIMSRHAPAASSSSSIHLASGPSSRTSSTSGSKEKRPALTLEQREAAYQEARQRIFKEVEESVNSAEEATTGVPAEEGASSNSARVKSSIQSGARPPASSAPRRSREAPTPGSQQQQQQQMPKLRPSAPAFDPTGGPSGFVFYPPAPSTSTSHLPPPPEGYEYPPSPPLDPEEQHAHLYEYSRGSNNPLLMHPSSASSSSSTDPSPHHAYFPPHPPPPEGQTYAAVSPPQAYAYYHPSMMNDPAHGLRPSAYAQPQHHHPHSTGYCAYHVGPQTVSQGGPPPPPLPPLPPASPQQPIYYYTVASTQPPPSHLQPQLIQPQQTAQMPPPQPAARYVPFPSASDTASNASSSASTAEHASVGYDLRPSSSSSSINSHPSLGGGSGTGGSGGVPTLGGLAHPLVARAASEISAPSSSVSSTGSSRTSKTAASSFSSSSKPISLGPGLPPLGSMKENYNKPARSKRHKHGGGGRRSSASQASDDLASERLSEAGSIGVEREPHPLPSKPEWIKTKAVRKDSSSSSRAASVSSALSNSARSL